MRIITSSEELDDASKSQESILFNVDQLLARERTESVLNQDAEPPEATEDEIVYELEDEQVYGPVEWVEVPRSTEVMAIGDLHGSMEAFEANMKHLNLINESGDWIGGNRKVVFHGDILADRGTDGIAILEKIHALRKQARLAGGNITVLAGNHEDFAISFLIGRTLFHPEGRVDPYSMCMLYSQGKGILELAQFGSQDVQSLNPNDYSDSFELWDNLKDEKQLILENMRQTEHGREILEEICDMRIAEVIDDTLFLHCPPTTAMLEEILNRGGADEINQIFQAGLRGAIFEDIEPSQEFHDIADTFLDTHNRTPFSDDRYADALRSIGINAVFFGHHDETHDKWGNVIGVGYWNEGEVTLVAVDRSAFKAGCLTDERSAAWIDKAGEILIGPSNEKGRELPAPAIDPLAITLDQTAPLPESRA
jgi:hypothetical protein